MDTKQNANTAGIDGSQDSTPPASPGRVSWSTCSIVVLLTAMAGMAVFTISPFWLAPPLLVYTPLVYLVLLFGWLPVLVICILLRPSGGCRRWVLLLFTLAALMVNLFWCLSMAPYKGVGWLGAAPAEADCSQESLADGRVRYACTSTRDSDGTVWVLEGARGSVLVKFVLPTQEDSELNQE